MQNYTYISAKISCAWLHGNAANHIKSRQIAINSDCRSMVKFYQTLIARGKYQMNPEELAAILVKNHVVNKERGVEDG